MNGQQWVETYEMQWIMKDRTECKVSIDPKDHNTIGELVDILRAHKYVKEVYGVLHRDCGNGMQQKLTTQYKPIVDE